MDIFLKSGIFGLFIVAFFILLTLTGIIVVAITRSRRANIVFIFLSFIPILLGLCGTLAGNMTVNKFVKEHGQAISSEVLNHPQSIIQEGRKEARLSTYLGLGATTALLIVFGIGFTLTRKVEQAVALNRP